MRLEKGAVDSTTLPLPKVGVVDAFRTATSCDNPADSAESNHSQPQGRQEAGHVLG